MRPLALFRVTLIALGAAAMGAPAGAGPIAPPAGPIGPTMKTLQQLEPRIPLGPETTPGDADSVYKITQAGSYYLTGNITGESGKNGIKVAVAENHAIVTIDLGGFTVRGLSGSLNGVRVQGGTFVLRNGIVQGWGESGVSAVTSASGSYQDVIAVGNTGTGFEIARGSTLQNCVARFNGQGFRAAACAISNCVAYQNTGRGFELFSSCSLTSCTAHQNGGAGYEGSGVSLTGCTADGNGGIGFDLHSSTATGCVAHSNLLGFAVAASTVRGCTVTSSAGSGIHCEGNCLIVENAVRFNGRTDSLIPAAGILVAGTNNRVEGNNVSETNLGGNDYGIWASSAGNIVVRNTCSNNAINYMFIAGNTTGPIITASGNITTTNPWANFEY